MKQKTGTFTEKDIKGWIIEILFLYLVDVNHNNNEHGDYNKDLERKED